MKIGNKKISSLAGIILAGGKSSRVGLNKNKAHLKLAGKTLIDWVISKLTSLDNLKEEDVIIVGPKEKYPHFKQVVEDIFPQKGPLGGIYSGLRASPSQYNIVVGCDMPFLEVKLLQHMSEDIHSNDIVIPRYGDGYIEPLCAIYSKRCLEAIERNLSEHNFSVRAIFPHLKVKFIEDQDIKKFDPEFHSFFNINYKKDMIEAEKIINNRRE